MLSITHAMTGAYIASLCPEPLFYMPVAIFMHYLEDSVPHWDAAMLCRKKDGEKSTSGLIFWGMTDLLVAGGLVFVVFQGLSWPTSWTEINWPAWLGAGAGILPDIIEVPNSFFKKKPAILKPFFKIHKAVHQKIYNFWWGFLLQALIVGSIIWLTKFYL